jgi:predicted nucleotidyltransferase
MPGEISKEQMARYRTTAQRRQQQKARQLALRQQRAWRVVQRAAPLLKTKFGAKQVVVFGSVLAADRFHQHSDVDLAVWGLDETRYYRAVAQLLDLDPAISVDFVEVEFASPVLRAVIEQEGVVL